MKRIKMSFTLNHTWQSQQSKSPLKIENICSMIGIRSADEIEPRLEIRYRLAARVQIFYHDTVCYSQLVLGHFGGVGSSRTIPTTNRQYSFRIGWRVSSRSPAHQWIALLLNRLPTKEQPPIQTFFPLGFITS